MDKTIETVYELLYSRVYHKLLNGFYHALINDDSTKFFGFTYVKINKAEYADDSFMLSELGAHSSYGDPEKTKKHLDSHTWQNKTTDECIEEGIYTAYAITFIAALYENKWFVKPWLTYFGTEISEDDAKQILLFRGHPINDEIWNGGLFAPNEPMALPDEKKFRNIEEDEFADVPWLVSSIKTERKQAVNLAFRGYFNEEVFKPFFEKLRLKEPQQYLSYYHYLSEPNILIFPEHKKYTIMIIMIADNNNQYRNEYFVFMQDRQKIYQWKYPPAENYISEYDYGQEVISILNKISNWDDRQFLNSSRTMDDANFWDSYVFKKEHGNYIYLQDVDL